MALATFNGQRFLRAQLDSLAQQAAPPAELVVADDCSSDDTVAIVRSFAQSAPFPVRIIENKSQLGYRSNFMQAAAACSSELIAFCDQDDLWAPNKLSVMQEAFLDRSVLLAYHNATLTNAHGSIVGKTFYRSQANTIEPLSLPPSRIIPGLAQVVRRSLVRLTPLHEYSIDPYAPDQRMPHDLWYPFWASVLGKIEYVPYQLVRYRQHEANLSGWPTNLRAYVRDEICNAKLYAVSNDRAAKNRLELLRRSQAITSAEERARIDAAIFYYKKYSETTSLRRQLYEAPTIAARAKCLFSLLWRGTYTATTSYDLWLATLLLDAFIGVPFFGEGSSANPS